MTEEDAKSKWCPHARIALRTGYGAGNRAMVGDWTTVNGRSNRAVEGASNCIGSACMAWRIGRKRNPDWKSQHGMISTSYERHPDDVAGPYIADDESGFCGLAGRPNQ